ncbi:MAG: hypothetical protein P4L83_16065, partial [Nevskia sp.]|nr:hypothetical protein [Nevskia sp.]
QSGGIEQVNQAITHMDEATQQNAALVEQVSASAQALEQQSEGLVASARRFVLQRDGGLMEVTSSPAAPGRKAVKAPAAAAPARPALKRVAKGNGAAPPPESRVTPLKRDGESWTEF